MDPANPEVDPVNWSTLNTHPSGCSGGTYNRFEAESWTQMVYSGNTSPMDESNCNDLALANDVAALLAGYPASENKDKPFFIACGFFRPHLPWNSPKEFWDLYDQGSLTIPPGYKSGDLADIPGASAANIHQELVDKDKWIEAIHAYLACISLADHNVGVVLDALENSVYKDNTIVVFVGDHGWHLGEKDRWSKFAVYDQANHTTLVIYDPQAGGNGSVCSKVVSMQDLYPTLIELAGLPPKTDIEGRSLLPLLNDPSRSDWDYPVLMTYSSTDYIKTNQFRFVNDGTSSQLYNIAIDPHEWDNLYGLPGSGVIVDMLKGKIDSMKQIGFGLKSKLLSGYSFTPAERIIPGIIEAEDYDEGAGGQVYFDQTQTNSGGQYRNDGVDIFVTDDLTGAFHVEMETGEWMQYTISDVAKGIYDISARVRNPGASPARMVIMINDEKAGEITIPQGSSWSDLGLEQVNIDFQGYIRLKVLAEDNGIQFNYLKFTKIQDVGNQFVLRDDGSRSFLISNRISDRFIHLDLSSFNPVMLKFEIFSIKGSKLEEGYLPGELNISYEMKSELDSGLYIFRVFDGENERFEKFVKVD
jgi:hypothetical protein